MPARLAKKSCPVAQPGLFMKSALPCHALEPDLRGDVEDAAGGAAHFRVVGLELHPHVLDGFGRRHPGRAVEKSVIDTPSIR